MFIPLLPFSAFPFVGFSHFTVNPFEATPVWAMFWTFCTDPFTAMSAYDTMASPGRREAAGIFKIAPSRRHVEIGPPRGSPRHDPHRHEPQPETARGGLPSVLRASALRVLRLGRLAGHG